MCATADCFSESDHTEENPMESFPPDNNKYNNNKKKTFLQDRETEIM